MAHEYRSSPYERWRKRQQKAHAPTARKKFKVHFCESDKQIEDPQILAQIEELRIEEKRVEALLFEIRQRSAHIVNAALQMLDNE